LPLFNQNFTVMKKSIGFKSQTEIEQEQEEKQGDTIGGHHEETTVSYFDMDITMIAFIHTMEQRERRGK